MDEEKQIICVPGQRLTVSDNFKCGKGTYERNGFIFSSLAGVVRVIEANGEDAKIVQVCTMKEQGVIPAAGDIVTAKVTHVNKNYCRCVIKCIGNIVLKRSYRAVLRREDIRSSDKDNIMIHDCYKTGDIIVAKILPLTELNCYYLTTAENELGVALAFYNGEIMRAISWTEMQCPKTKNREKRKVAQIASNDTISNFMCELRIE